MRYTVEFTPTADAELRSAFTYIYLRSPRNALRWLQNIKEAANSLRDFPSRCGIAPETKHLGEELRHYVFHSHRIIFTIDDSTQIVRILYVRHGKMRAVGEPIPDDE